MRQTPRPYMARASWVPVADETAEAVAATRGCRCWQAGPRQRSSGPDEPGPDSMPRLNARRTDKVKWSSLTLAALSLTAAAALPASAQVNTGSITTNSQGIFNLAEAYPCTPGTYADNLGVAPLRVFN